jgi:hypothetical protein
MSDYIDRVKQQQQQQQQHVQSITTTNSQSSSSSSSQDDSFTASRSQESPDNDRLTDIIMTRLRTSDGFDLEWLSKFMAMTQSRLSFEVQVWRWSWGWPTSMTMFCV